MFAHAVKLSPYQCTCTNVRLSCHFCSSSALKRPDLVYRKLSAS